MSKPPVLAYRSRNRDACLARRKRQRDRRPGHGAEVQRLRRQTKPEGLMLTRAKGRAKRAGIDFNLTIGDIVIPTHCPVFGVTLHTGGRRTNDHASLDRINPRKGYVKGNVWVISYRANRIKNDATLKEIEAIAAAIRKMRDRPNACSEAG